MKEAIGFIGVGLMGHGMISNLLKNDYPVVAMAHRNRKPLEDLLTKGATEAGSPAEIAAQSDIIIFCVTGSPQVEQIVYGDAGLLEGLKTGQLVMDCSTAEPSSTEKINNELRAHGVTMVDAPLARTPIEAAAGKLNTMVGASEEAFQRVEPILATFCENIFHVGEVGAGHKTKLINNFLAMGHGALIAEALCACAATGVDIQKFYEVVSAGGADSGIFQLIVPKAMKGDPSGLKFSLPNAAKDLGYYTRLTDGAQLTGPIGKAIHHAFVQGMKLGFEDGYVGSLIDAQAKLNRIDIIDS
jgi:3-hydroxyisobutyrate dehydrogenase-like beta-hydroxyacid dehydrogenase